jgi:hypothetical protein
LVRQQIWSILMQVKYVCFAPHSNLKLVMLLCCVLRTLHGIWNQNKSRSRCELCSAESCICSNSDVAGLREKRVNLLQRIANAFRCVSLWWNLRLRNQRMIPRGKRRTLPSQFYCKSKRCKYLGACRVEFRGTLNSISLLSTI